MIPLYLLHVTNISHSENPGILWVLLVFNIFVVAAGIIFMYQLFKLQKVLKSGIIFGIAILLNFILIAIFGDPFDLLG